MFRLTLLRHAKSAQGDGKISDIQRTLNQRGRHDAALMGRVCAEKLPPPGIILASSAQRVRETLDLFLAQWTAVNREVDYTDDLYLASSVDLQKLIRQHSGQDSHLFICGHQPTLGELAYWLCADFDSDIPTTAVLSILFPSGGMERNAGKMDFYASPRNYT